MQRQFCSRKSPWLSPQENTWTELLVEFAFIAPYRRSVADPSRRGHYLRGVHFAILIFASRDGFFRRRFLPFLPFLSPGGALPRQPPPSVSSVRSAFFFFFAVATCVCGFRLSSFRPRRARQPAVCRRCFGSAARRRCPSGSRDWQVNK